MPLTSEQIRQRYLSDLREAAADDRVETQAFESEPIEEGVLPFEALLKIVESNIVWENENYGVIELPPGCMLTSQDMRFLGASDVSWAHPTVRAHAGRADVLVVEIMLVDYYEEGVS